VRYNNHRDTENTEVAQETTAKMYLLGHVTTPLLFLFSTRLKEIWRKQREIYDPN